MIAESVVVNVAGGLDVRLPGMIPVRQRFETTRVADVTAAVAEQFRRPEIRSKVVPGMSIAVGVGSRGIADIVECTRQSIAELRRLGALPFIVPAMGSHGAATAEGQRDVLARYGITEERMGCPVRAQMDVVELGAVDGSPVYMDQLAAAADGIVVVCRVKPHTSFRAPIESGIVKMLTIGLGKMIGAAELHTHGMERFGELLPAAARTIMASRNFLMGIALVENAADETALIEAVPAERIFDREPELLALAKSLMARLYFKEIDVLVVDRIGKNISGAGMDPNITGRNARSTKWVQNPRVQQIVVLGLTPETHGNAAGVGLKSWRTAPALPSWQLPVPLRAAHSRGCGHRLRGWGTFPRYSAGYRAPQEAVLPPGYADGVGPGGGAASSAVELRERLRDPRPYR